MHDTHLLVQLKRELDSSVQEAEEALLEIKRARLLGDIDRLEVWKLWFGARVLTIPVGNQ